MLARPRVDGTRHTAGRDDRRPARFRVVDAGPSRPRRLVLSSLRRGRADPCYRVQPDGVVWRADPQRRGGPCCCASRPGRPRARCMAHAWGPGADAALDGVPALLGDADDPAGFVPRPEHRRLCPALAHAPHWRVARTRAVFEALAAAALEQRVTGGEAHAGLADAGDRLRRARARPGRRRRHASPPACGVPPTPQHWAADPVLGVAAGRRRRERRRRW